MATTATAVRQRRRVIQRPRLLALLDESKAQIKTLVAPAGYGKTTLAEQWVQAKGRGFAWYTTRRASTDVAGLALGLARACSVVVEGCDERLREHLRALSGSTAKVDVLAEILAEDLAEWPTDSWLVLDDYHEILGAEEAEHFVETLVGSAPIQLLVASRQRPTWVTARRILYDEVLELNQTTLAMDASEASEVLAGRSPPSASGLVAVANGWPAVIGLAGVTTAEIEEPEQLPEALYRFFAEEVFASFDDEVKAGVATLAVAPLLDRTLATALLGQDTADTVCAAVLEVGILVERGIQLELHPLARSFLEDRGAQLGFAAAADSAATVVEHYENRRDWDAAFDVIARNQLGNHLEPLMILALDDLLDTGRLQTIEEWCTLGASLGLQAPAFALARAEVALRRGHLTAAQSFAWEATSPPSELKFRALSVGGRAAHLASREEEALNLYRQAEALAITDGARRDALWGQLICAVELELPEATTRLEDLVEGVSRADPRGVIQSVTYQLAHGIRFGRFDPADAESAHDLLPSVDDPLVLSSFQAVYAWALALAARYERSFEVANDLLATAERYRLDFARPYALSTSAVSCAGLRRWQEAEELAAEALARSQEMHDAAGQQHAFSVYLRVLTQQGRQHFALTLEMPPLRQALPSAHAEVLLCRALVLASAGRIDEARHSARDVQSSSRSTLPVVLAAAVEAVSAVRQSEPLAIDKIVELDEIAFSRGALDLLVTVYRSSPAILPILLRASPQQERLRALLRQVGDEDLAAAAGHPLPVDGDSKTQLSPREREVYELVGQSLTNLQIAQLLFISEGTVKVHVHHIFEKLGIRSRTALAVQAALERANQATSAIEANESDGDS